MSVITSPLFKNSSRVLHTVYLATAMLSVVLMTGCASKPQMNNGTRYAVAPDAYTVRSGDTLSGIAARYGLDYINVAKMNDIALPYNIYVGQSLRLKNAGYQQTTTTQAMTQSTPIQSQSMGLPTTKPINSVPIENVASPVTQTGLRWARPSQGPILQGFDLTKDVKGIRFGGQVGDAVLAAADGQVVYAADGLKEYGQLVLIKHINGYISAYAHNSKIMVKSGENVTIGKKIAEMGNSGTTQTMLEFQVRLDGKPINPTAVLSIN